ncbi:hypothetical protein EV363DRAFT_1357334, partial [Boletus edulis]
MMAPMLVTAIMIHWRSSARKWESVATKSSSSMLVKSILWRTNCRVWLRPTGLSGRRPYKKDSFRDVVNGEGHADGRMWSGSVGQREL